jgi:hypothetical protein
VTCVGSFAGKAVVVEHSNKICNPIGDVEVCAAAFCITSSKLANDQCLVAIAVVRPWPSASFSLEWFC